MKTQKFQERGITLIALVITIIVLLILAGVTLNIVINTGLLSNTEKATYLYEEKAIQEALSLEVTNYEINTMNETTKDYFGYLKGKGIITEQTGGETEEDEKGKKAEIITKKLINTTTKRKYYLYANGELYVEILKSGGEKYIGTLWDGNGVILPEENGPVEETVADLIREDKIKVGDYVPYNMSEEKTYTIWEGEIENDDCNLQSENMQWRVLSIDSEKEEITLITERPTNTGFYIPEEKSDEEAILEINKACEALYGDGTNTCRSLNVNDFSLYNFEAINIVEGNGKDKFYYNNLVETGTCTYYTMLVVNDSDLDCYNFNRSNTLIGRSFYPDNNDSPEYVPIRPVITLSGETEIEVDNENVDISITKDEGIASVSDGVTIAKGESLEITANVENEYKFNCWKILDGEINIEDRNSSTTKVIAITDAQIIAKANKIVKDNTKGLENTTLSGDKNFKYNNPVIPVGFKAIDTEEAKWKLNGSEVEGWNNGLVIEDSEGNEFVWVPVNNTTVKYEKINNSYSDDRLPTGIENEESQIEDYEGFYIARYEAGIPEGKKSVSYNETGIPVSKKNQIPWSNIDYENAQTNAESMYNSNYVQSGLVTGRMWAATMKWLEESGVDVETDSTGWGNYLNAQVTDVTQYIYLTNFTFSNFDCPTVNSITKGEVWSGKTKYYSEPDWIIKTGNTEYTRKNNIYDLAGNLWEYTNEINVDRGGGFYHERYFISASACIINSSAYYMVRFPCCFIH